MNVAHFKVLRDSEITLTPGGAPWVREFTLPEHTNYETWSVLAFVANPSDDANLTLQVEVNGNVVRSPRFIGGGVRGMWEVLSAGDLEEGDNEVRFTVTTGKGSLGVLDVVLWYVRET